jgi:glycosyltransferase involved in cell wall biosynthesis
VGLGLLLVTIQDGPNNYVACRHINQINRISGLKNRLAILATHPIQYHSPVFKELSKRQGIDLRVFYGWSGTTNSIDHGFGRAITWDIPLLDGYDWEMIPNVARDPGTHHFNGIVLPELITRITKWNAHAILVYGWNFHAHLRAMKYFKGKIPVLFRGDSTLLDEYPGIRRFARRLYLKHIYRNIDFALAVGTHNRCYFQAVGIPPERIFLAPHAIDNQRFQNDSHRKTEAATLMRRNMGIEDNHVVIMFVGKLETKKAPDLLLHAFEKMNLDDMHLVFAGSGELEETLKAIAKTNRIHFLGFQNQTTMETIYHMADAVILPSRGPGETWGLALNEAIACGRAIIASDRAGAAIDLIDEGLNGWIVKHNDCLAIQRALESCQRLGRIGLESLGRQSSQKTNTFSINSQVDGIIRCLQFACNPS